MLLVCVIVLFSCCAKDQEDCGDVDVTYHDSIKSIIEESCNNGDCHVGPNGGWGVLPDFSSYNNLLIYLNNGTLESRINSMDTTLSMPPLFREDRQISDADLKVLNIWICNGFPEE